MTATVYVVKPGTTELQILDEPMWYPDPLVSYGVTGIDYYGGEMLDPDSIYRTQRSVRTVVNFIAKSFAQVSLHAFSVDGEGDRNRLPADDPISQTLMSPDGVHTAYEFARARIIDLCMWERYAALRVLQTDGTVQLRRLPPKIWRFTRNRDDVPTGVRINDKTYELDQFLWLDGYAASEQSPMAHLAELLIEERESGRHRIEQWKNGAKIDGVVTRPNEAPEWSSKARERWRAGWIAAYTGRGSRVGGTPLLEDGMDFKEVKGFTARETQQIEARKLATAEVAAAFNIAPQLVGVTGDANYSNVIAFRQMLYDDTLGPAFMQDAQAWNLRVIRGMRSDVFVEHNVAEKLRMSFEEQAAILSSAIGGPWLTRNEGRRRQNLPKIEGADTLIQPLNVDTLDPDGGDKKAEGRTLTVAEQAQKLYLAENKILTRDEIRALLGYPPAEPGQFPEEPEEAVAP